MKRGLLGFIVGIVVCSMTCGHNIAEGVIAFAYPQLRIVINGKDVGPTEAQAEIQNNRVFVFLRFISECMNHKVSWNDATKEVTIDDSIVHRVGSNYVELENSKKIEIDIPSYVRNGSTMVPIRMISEALGAKSNWDDATKTVSITSKDQTGNSDLLQPVRVEFTRGAPIQLDLDRDNVEDTVDLFRNLKRSQLKVANAS